MATPLGDDEIAFLPRLIRLATIKPNRLAIAWWSAEARKEDEFTYGQLVSVLTHGAAQLIKLGVKRGDRVLLVFPPGLDFYAAFLSCLAAGAVAVPQLVYNRITIANAPATYISDATYPVADSSLGKLNIALRKLNCIVENCKPILALSTSAYVRKVVRLSTIKNKITGGESWPELKFEVLARNATPVQSGNSIVPTGPNDLAFLQYTSGTTGDPKGVMVSHGCLAHNLKCIALSVGIDEPTTATWLPAYHDMGLIAAWLSAMWCGAELHSISPIDFLRDPGLWIELMSRTKAKKTGAPNFAFELAARKWKSRPSGHIPDLSNLSYVMNGAEQSYISSMDAFAKTFAPLGFKREAFVPGYGLAEHVVYICDRPREVPLQEIQGRVDVGRPRFDIDVRIVDPVALKECTEGQDGEIWVNSPSKTLGYNTTTHFELIVCRYYNKPEQTEAAFNGRIADSPPSAPLYLRTGDRGSMHGGHLVVTGRIKDMIIIRGRNYYPTDIEHALQEALPQLRPGCIAAFAIEEQREERLVIVAEIREDCVHQPTQKWEALAKDVRTIVQRTCELYCSSTTSGKLQRNACKQLVLSGEIKSLWSSAFATTTSGNSSPKPESVLPIAPMVTLAELEEAVSSSSSRCEDLMMLFVKQQLAFQLGINVESISSDTSVWDMGLDSLKSVELKGAMEEQLGLPLPVTLVYEYVTVRDISVYLAGRIAAESNRDATKLNERLAKKVSAWHMALLYTLQCIAVIVMAAILAYPAYLVVRLYITILRDTSLAVALVLLPFSFPIYGLLVCIGIAIAKWIVIGRASATTFSVWSIAYVRWWMVHQLLRIADPIFIGFLRGTPLMNVWLIILGARVHMSAYINTVRISEPDLVSIGRATILDAQSVISPHTTEMGGIIRIAPINLPAGSYVACSGAVYGPCKETAPIHVNALSVHRRDNAAATPKYANTLAQSCPSATSLSSSSSSSSPSGSIQSDASAALCPVSYRPCPFRLTISAITALFSVILIGAISIAASYPAYRLAALLSRHLDLVEFDLATVDMGYVLLGLCFTLPWPALLPLMLLFAQFNGVQLLAPGWLGPLPIFVPLLEILKHIGRHHLPALLLVFAVAYTIHLWIFIGCVIGLKWLLLGRERASSHRLHSFAAQRSYIFSTLHYAFYLRHVISFPGTGTLRLLWRLMGARIGHRVVIANCPDGFDHPDLISIGNDAHIGDLCMIRCSNVAPDGTVEIGNIKLGNRTLVGMRAVIQGHSSVPNDCIVGALSLIEQHQTVPEGVQALIGVPARASPPRKSSSDHPPVQSVWFQIVHWMLSLLTPFFVSFQLALTIFFPALLLVSWLQHHLSWAIVYGLSPLLLLAVLAAAIGNLVITKWVYMLRLRRGEHHIRRIYFTYALNTSIAFGLDLLSGSWLLPFIWRSLGAHIGKRVTFLSIGVTEPDLLHVSKQCVIGEDAILFGHVVERGVMVLDRTVLQRNTVIGRSSVVLLGAQIRSGAALEPLSLVMKKDSLASGHLYSGVPCKVQILREESTSSSSAPFLQPEYNYPGNNPTVRAILDLNTGAVRNFVVSARQFRCCVEEEYTYIKECLTNDLDKLPPSPLIERVHAAISGHLDRMSFPTERLYEITQAAKLNGDCPDELRVVLERYLWRAKDMETRVREMQTPGRLTEAELAQLNPNDPTDAAIIMSHYYYELRFEEYIMAEIWGTLLAYLSPSQTILFHTSALLIEDPLRRGVDTHVLLRNFYDWGIYSKRGQQAVSIINTIHGRYSIPNGEFFFTYGAVFLALPVFAERCGARALKPYEMTAHYTITTSLARAMGIKEIPNTHEEFTSKWFAHFRHIRRNGYRTAISMFNSTLNAWLNRQQFSTDIMRETVRKMIWHAVPEELRTPLEIPAVSESDQAEFKEAMRLVHAANNREPRHRQLFCMSLRQEPPYSNELSRVGPRARGAAFPQIDGARCPFSGAQYRIGSASNHFFPEHLPPIQTPHDLDNAPLPEYTLAQAQEAFKDKTWLVIDNFIYDITSILDDHPGGRKILERNLGRDASRAFKRHTLSTRIMALNWRVGMLCGSRVFVNGKEEEQLLLEPIESVSP